MSSTTLEARTKKLHKTAAKWAAILEDPAKNITKILEEHKPTITYSPQGHFRTAKIWIDHLEIEVNTFPGYISYMGVDSEDLDPREFRHYFKAERLHETIKKQVPKRITTGFTKTK